jgi:hypothetical protein
MFKFFRGLMYLDQTIQPKLPVQAIPFVLACC